jgi:hypothetical protein
MLRANSIISVPFDGNSDGLDAILGVVEPTSEPVGGKIPDSTRFEPVTAFKWLFGAFFALVMTARFVLR